MYIKHDETLYDINLIKTIKIATSKKRDNQLHSITLIFQNGKSIETEIKNNIGEALVYVAFLERLIGDKLEVEYESL